jgi:hypothetical protein
MCQIFTASSNLRTLCRVAPALGYYETRRLPNGINLDMNLLWEKIVITPRPSPPPRTTWAPELQRTRSHQLWRVRPQQVRSHQHGELKLRTYSSKIAESIPLDLETNGAEVVDRWIIGVPYK